MEKKPSQTPEQWFHAMGTAYVETQILFHLNQVGVFNYLEAHGQATSAELATSLNLNHQTLDCLLDYTFSVGHLLTRDQQDRYAFSEFGESVLKRYGRRDGEQAHFNFWDVRVGAYHPVWSAMGDMLTGKAKYGEQVIRNGKFAEDGVYKSALGFLPALTEVLKTCEVSNETRAIVELGVNSGLLEHLAPSFPGASFFGLDRDPSTLELAEKRFSNSTKQHANWIEADLFSVSEWHHQIQDQTKPVFLSLHFHEFMAKGAEALIHLVRELKERFPGSTLIALEQPRLPIEARDSTSESLWKYSQSNILIHHLIGNGRILTSQSWREIFEKGGGHLKNEKPTGYLGYQLFQVEL